MFFLVWFLSTLADSIAILFQSALFHSLFNSWNREQDLAFCMESIWQNCARSSTEDVRDTFIICKANRAEKYPASTLPLRLRLGWSAFSREGFQVLGRHFPGLGHRPEASRKIYISKGQRKDLHYTFIQRWGEQAAPLHNIQSLKILPNKIMFWFSAPIIFVIITQAEVICFS